MTSELQKLQVDRVGNAREQAREANERVDDYRAMYKSMSDAVDELRDENDGLRAQVSEQERTIERQKALLKDWMVSQVAFKNLFKKYGKLPDGRDAASLSSEERKKIVAAEREEVLNNDPGLINF